MRNILKIFSGVIILVLVSKCLGFVRESFVATIYGAGYISDVYVIEDGLINAIYTVCAGVISTTYIPKILELNKKKKDAFTSNYFNILLSIMILVSIFMIIFSPIILKILVPGFYSMYSTDVIHSLIIITRINMVSLILVFIENYLIVILQANNYFIFSSLQGIVLNFSVIIYLAFFNQYEITGIIITKIIAHLLNAIMLIVFINYKKTFKYHFIYNIKDNNIAEVFRNATPVLVVNIVSQLNYIVDRSMASGLDSGSMALLSYANTIASLLYSVVGTSICNIAYTKISEKQGDKIKIGKSFNEYLDLLLCIVLPCCVVMCVDSDILCGIIYGRGKINSDNINVLSRILWLYIPSNFAMCVRDLYNRLLYINKNTKIPSLINMIGLILNIIFNFVFTRLIGVYGLALATSLTGVIALIVSQIYCKNHLNLKLRKQYSVIVKIIISSLLCCMIKQVIPCYKLINKIIIVVISGLISLLIFNYDKFIRERRKGIF